MLLTFAEESSDSESCLQKIMPKIHLTSKENTIFHLKAGREKTYISVVRLMRCDWLMTFKD